MSMFGFDTGTFIFRTKGFNKSSFFHPETTKYIPSQQDHQHFKNGPTA